MQQASERCREERQQRQQTAEEPNEKDTVYDSNEVIEGRDLGFAGYEEDEDEEEEEEEEEDGPDDVVDEIVSSPIGKEEDLFALLPMNEEDDNVRRGGGGGGGGDDEGEQIAEGEEGGSTDGEEQEIVIPNVVDLFFAHPVIRQAIDKAECQFFQDIESEERRLMTVIPAQASFTFGQSNSSSSTSPSSSSIQPTQPTAMEAASSDVHASWYIGDVLETLVDMIERRNAAHGSSTASPSRLRIWRDLLKVYRKRFVPFLALLGVATNAAGMNPEASLAIHADEEKDGPKCTEQVITISSNFLSH